VTEWWQGFTYGALAGWLVSVLATTVVMILIAGGSRRPTREGSAARLMSSSRHGPEPAFFGKKPPRAGATDDAPDG
jgi:hypothetical protein